MTSLQLAQLEALLPDHQLQACTLLEQQGHSNRSYRLQTDKGAYFVRLFTPSTLSRREEFQIETLAHTQGIAPEPVALDTVHGILVTAFIEGEHRTTLAAEALRQLAHALARLHATPYQADPVVLEVDTGVISSFTPEPVLCHNDPNPQNILWSPAPILIDWEYAGINDRYFDLAAVAVEFSLDLSEKEQLLQAYFASQDTPNYAKLEAYCTLYREVCAQWWEIKDIWR